MRIFPCGQLIAAARQIDLELDADAAGMRQQTDDTVAQVNRLFQIVGDEDNGSIAGARQRQHLVLQSLTRHRIECAEWLVHQQRLGLLGEAACNLQALLHTARHLGRIFSGMVGQSDFFQQLVNAGAAPDEATPDASSASETFPAAVRHGNSALP